MTGVKYGDGYIEIEQEDGTTLMLGAEIIHKRDGHAEFVQVPIRRLALWARLAGLIPAVILLALLLSEAWGS